MQIQTEAKNNLVNKKFKMPDAYVLLFLLPYFAPLLRTSFLLENLKGLQTGPLQRQYQVATILFRNHP